MYPGLQPLGRRQGIWPGLSRTGGKKGSLDFGAAFSRD